MTTIRITHPTSEISGTIELDGSKSISNRVLVIRALSRESFKIHRLSTSDDTRKMENLLSGEPKEVYNVGHAGTTFRFLTAFLALQPGTQLLTGSSRMLQRPIGPLVDALRSLGCHIEYVGNTGYPPLRIGSVDVNDLNDHVTIDAGISSQYITALVLIAPVLPKGLTIHLEGSLVSESYLDLTFQIVREFGIDLSYNGSLIRIKQQEYSSKDYTVEADWSAGSYHYSLVALASKANLCLKGLFKNSYQGDSALVGIGNHIGVQSTWTKDHLFLSKKAPDSQLTYDFINQPDIAQTMAVICAAKEIQSDFFGLKTLRIKETDRIDALNRELIKIKSGFSKISDTEEGEHYGVKSGISFKNGIPRFDTYQDHRMAMAFAPLALISPIEINEPNVVTKSYPNFWKDLESLGFSIDEVNT